MAHTLPVPEVAAGATEVIVSEWLVAEGEEFKSGDPIVVVETEKAVVEIEADQDATLLRQLVPPGATAEVGTPMAAVGTAEEAAGDVDAILAELSGTARTAATGLPPETAAEPEVEATPEAEPAPPARVFISPLARRLLTEAGLGPEGIAGTGPKHRILKRDVLPVIAAAREAPSAAPPAEVVPAPQVPPAPEVTPAPEEPAAPAPASVAPRPVAARRPDASVTEEPHSRLRRAIARRLTESKQQVPHFYVTRQAQVGELLGLRATLNEVSPTRISVNDLVVRAAAVAYAAVPEANVTWSEEALLHHASVDLGIAVASARGLVTPVLRDLERSTPSAVARQTRDLAERADAGQLRQDELEGGTMTISNLGMYGVHDFAAIINPPQSAILAVGAARTAPGVVNGELAVVSVMDLTLSVDHRAVDGALAARWLAALVEALEQPLRLVA